MKIILAAIPTGEEDGSLCYEERFISIKGDSLAFDDGYSTVNIPHPTQCEWADIPMTDEMGCPDGDYSGLYLPDGEFAASDEQWCESWGVDLDSLPYQMGFGEATAIALKYLRLQEEENEFQSQKWEQIRKEQAEAEAKAEAARLAQQEQDWQAYLAIKDLLDKSESYEDSDYFAVMYGKVVKTEKETFKTEGVPRESSDGMGMRSYGGGWVTVHKITFELPDGTQRKISNPPEVGLTEQEWALQKHSPGYWSSKKFDLEETEEEKAARVAAIEAAFEARMAAQRAVIADQTAIPQGMIDDFIATYPDLIKQCRELEIRIKLTTESRRLVVRTKSVPLPTGGAAPGMEVYPTTEKGLHQAVVEAIAFEKQRLKDVETAKQAKEAAIAVSRERQEPYKLACENAGFKVKWNQFSDKYEVISNNRKINGWDCQAICRKQNLSVVFPNGKPKPAIKKKSK